MNHTKRYTEARLKELEDARQNQRIDSSVVEPAWMYILNKETGEITEIEGTYLKSWARSYFFIKDTDDFYEGVPVEGKVNRGRRVWLSKQDKGQAAFIFGAHFQKKISTLLSEADELTDIVGRIHY